MKIRYVAVKNGLRVHIVFPIESNFTLCHIGGEFFDIRHPGGIICQKCNKTRKKLEKSLASAEYRDVR
jgi:hypothetical protein